MTRWTARAGRVLASGPIAGALLLAAFFFHELLTSDLDFRGFGDQQVIAAVLDRARAHGIKAEALVLATLCAAGALFGAFGAACGRLWDFALGRPPSRWGALRGLAAALVLHGYLLARSMILHPQLYSRHFYERGGVRRDAMVFLTERVSIGLLDALAAALLLAALLPPLFLPRARAALLARGRAALAFARRRPRVAAGVAAAPVLAVVLLLVAGAGHARPRPPDRPNLLLIAVDSLRPDRVYGDLARARFPAMAGLAARGVRFRNAFVTQARTFPSFASLLTGRFPHHHGVRHEFEPPATRAALGPTLATVLAASGWRTAAVSDFSGEIFGRAPFGFQELDVPSWGLYTIVSEQVLDRHPSVLPYATSAWGERLFPEVRSMAAFDDPLRLAERAIDRLDSLGGGPFFLTVFFSAPHSPYPAPHPYYRAFTDPEYRGPYRYLKQPLPLLAALPPADARQVRALYDGSVAAVDAAIARILRRLEERGLAEHTIVVLLGDHGENLFDERGLGMGHGDHLWGDHANHIPLVVVDPTRDFPSHDVDGIVRDVDLAPTLAALLGVAPPPGPDGVDLAPLLSGAAATLELDAYAETGLWFLESGPGYSRKERLAYPNIWATTEATVDGDIFLEQEWREIAVTAKQRAIRTPEWKLVYHPTPAGVFWRLFDLVRDPRQRDDVAARHPDVVARLRRKLEPWITADGRTPILPEAP